MLLIRCLASAPFEWRHGLDCRVIDEGSRARPLPPDQRPDRTGQELGRGAMLFLQNAILDFSVYRTTL